MWSSGAALYVLCTVCAIIISTQSSLNVQNTNDIASNCGLSRLEDFTSLVPVWIASGSEHNTIHRFFDSSPFSPSGQYIALNALPTPHDKNVATKDSAIVVVDLLSGTSVEVGRTDCWDSQVGAQVQWGGSDRELFFNIISKRLSHTNRSTQTVDGLSISPRDRHKRELIRTSNFSSRSITKVESFGKLGAILAEPIGPLESAATLPDISAEHHRIVPQQSDYGLTARGVVYDMTTSTQRVLDCPVYHVRQDGRYAVSPNLHKIRYTQKGYGIIGYSGARPNKNAPDDDGLYITDTVTGQCRIFISLKELARQVGFDIEHTPMYGFHTKWSSDGLLIMFVVRTLELPAVGIFGHEAAARKLNSYKDTGGSSNTVMREVGTTAEAALGKLGAWLGLNLQPRHVRVQHLFVIDPTKLATDADNGNSTNGFENADNDADSQQQRQGFSASNQGWKRAKVKHVISWASKPFKPRSSWGSEVVTPSRNAYDGSHQGDGGSNATNARTTASASASGYLHHKGGHIVRLRDGNHPHWVAGTHKISMNLQRQPPRRKLATAFATAAYNTATESAATEPGRRKANCRGRKAIAKGRDAKKRHGRIAAGVGQHQPQQETARMRAAKWSIVTIDVDTLPYNYAYQPDHDIIFAQPAVRSSPKGGGRGGRGGRAGRDERTFEENRVDKSFSTATNTASPVQGISSDITVHDRKLKHKHRHLEQESSIPNGQKLAAELRHAEQQQGSPSVPTRTLRHNTQHQFQQTQVQVQDQVSGKRFADGDSIPVASALHGSLSSTADLPSPDFIAATVMKTGASDKSIDTPATIYRDGRDSCSECSTIGRALRQDSAGIAALPMPPIMTPAPKLVVEEVSDIGTGHPNFFPGERFLLVDAYAKELAQFSHMAALRDAYSAPLRLIDVQLNKEVWLLQVTWHSLSRE